MAAAGYGTPKWSDIKNYILQIDVGEYNSNLIYEEELAIWLDWDIVVVFSCFRRGTFILSKMATKRHMTI